jgi:ribosomal-protein-alanine N-acetyltransferase
MFLAFFVGLFQVLIEKNKSFFGRLVCAAFDAEVRNMKPKSPFPILSTRRLTLRKLTDGDLSELFEMRSNPEMHLFTDTVPDVTVKDTKIYLERMNEGVKRDLWIIWGIEHRLLHRLIGTISIWNFDEKKEKAELGFGLTPAFQGRGYMSEALKTVMDYGFQTLKLSVLEAYTDENNKPSIKLLNNAGFKYQNTIEEAGTKKENVFKMQVFSIKTTETH